MGVLPRRWSPTYLLILCFVAALWYLSSLIDIYAPPSLSNAPQPSKHKQDDGRYHWTKSKERYPVENMIMPPSVPPKPIPKLQHEFGPELEKEKSAREERQAAVKESFVRSWNSYKKNAWMQDELAPLSGGYVSSFGGWAATLVDSLDTLWIMGLKDDFEEAVKAVHGIDFTSTDAEVINVFETTIRYLGGLLGAYDLSGGKHSILLEKASELGQVLYGAFDTPNRMPITRWHWKDLGSKKHQASETALIAEVGSLTLEFTRLSQLTGEPKYYDAVSRITNMFEKAQGDTYIPGLWPIIMDAKSLTFNGFGFTLGGMADSLYEYLPKQHMLLGGTSNQYKQMYETAVRSMKKYIFFQPMTPDNKDILISGSAFYDKNSKTALRDPQGQHLGCFAGGMVAIGAKLFGRGSEELLMARKLVDGCIWAYDSMTTGIMPELFYLAACEEISVCTWNEKKWHEAILMRHEDFKGTESMSSDDRLKYIIKEKRLPLGYSDITDRKYVLRPEAIESIFVLYRITGDRSLQDEAWRMFQAIEKHTRTGLGNAAIDDVTLEKPNKEDRMESFWLAETLKYFYLIFSEPDVVSLDEYVLNTEAHPFKRPI